MQELSSWVEGGRQFAFFYMHRKLIFTFSLELLYIENLKIQPLENLWKNVGVFFWHFLWFLRLFCGLVVFLSKIVPNQIVGLRCSLPLTETARPNHAAPVSMRIHVIVYRLPAAVFYVFFIFFTFKKTFLLYMNCFVFLPLTVFSCLSRVFAICCICSIYLSAREAQICITRFRSCRIFVNTEKVRDILKTELLM